MKQHIRTPNHGGTQLWHPVVLASTVIGLLVAALFAVPSTAGAVGDDTAGQAGALQSVTPQRLMDTRTGLGAPRGPVQAYSAVTLPVAGVAGVPAAVSAVALNVTVTEPSTSGWVSAFANGTQLPAVSDINFTPNLTVANMVIAQVGSDGKVQLFNGSPGTVQLVVDVFGYFVSGTPSKPGSFAAVTPQRLLDSRYGIGGPRGAVAGNSGLGLKVSGVAGLPDPVGAVVLNVTVVDPAASGFLSAYAGGTGRPGVSNLNFVKNQTVAKLVVAPVGADGTVQIFNGSVAAAQIVADVAGYFIGGAADLAGAYTALAPQRLLDTRAGIGGNAAAVPANADVTVKVTGVAGVPTKATAVVLNVTVTSPATSGWAAAFADGGDLPPVSNVNFSPDQTVPNLVITKIGTNGAIRVHNGSAGTVQVIVDVFGYVTGTTPLAIPTAPPQALQTVNPARILDTRGGTGVPAGAVAPGGELAVQAGGVAGVPAGATAVLLNVTVTAPTQSGWVTAYADGTTLPPTSSVTFDAAQTMSTMVVARLGANGMVRLHNGSTGTVQLIADVSGYYAATAGSAPGTLVPVTPSRLLDTRTGQGGLNAPIAAWSDAAFQIAGVGGIPSSVGGLLLTVTAIAPPSDGWAAVYADGAALPSVSNLNFAQGRTVSNSVITQVGANGRVRIHNGSVGATDYVVDITGYFTAGAATAAGTFNSVTPARVFDSRTSIGGVPSRVPSANGISVQVGGLAGVPASVGAVVLNLTVVGPKGAGWVSAFADTTALPGVSNVNFAAGQTVPNLVVARMGQNGKVRLYNGSSRTVDLVVDVVGYIVGTPAAPGNAPLTAPLISTSRYPRNYTNTSGDQSLMWNNGNADAKANPAGNPYLILLDIGGQDSVDGGVVLSATSRFVSYQHLVDTINSYVDGFAAGQADDTPTTIVIGTNNDMDVSYATGADWAKRVVNPVRDYARKYANIVIGGANDMEPGFSADVTSTRNWLSGYLAGTDALFVFNGSADGCPTGSPGGACNHGWTEADLYWLSGGAAPNRILGLPQIYYTSMSHQWKYISMTGVNTGKPRINYIGPLTEWTACYQGGWWCDSMSGNDAWFTFWGDLQSDGRVSQANLPDSTDLRIN